MYNQTHTNISTQIKRHTQTNAAPTSFERQTNSNCTSLASPKSHNRKNEVKNKTHKYTEDMP